MPVTYEDLKKSREELAKVFNDEFQQYKERADQERASVGDALSDTKQSLDRVNGRLDELEAKWQRQLEEYEEAANRKDGPSPDEQRQAAYEKYLRKGERGMSDEELKTLETPTEKKLLSADSDPDGGYLVPQNVASNIIEYRRTMSPIRQFANVVTISQGDSFEQPVEASTDFSAGWTGERSTSGETTTGQFDYERIPTHELDARPQATRQMIEDSAFDLEAWVEGRVGNKFARTEATAFVNGDGHFKPEGIMQDSRITTISSGAASSLTYQGLLNLVYDIEEEEYVQNARLFFNRKTMADIRGISDDNNMPIYDIGAPTEGPAVEGYPFSTATDIATVGAGAKAILFADLSIVYTVVDRLDMWFQRDPFTVKPKIEYYYRTRVGGQVVRPEGARIQVVES